MLHDLTSVSTLHLLPLLLQAEPAGVAAAAAQTIKQQSTQTGEMLKDYGALVNVLYLIAIGGIVCFLGAIVWIVRRGDSFAATVQTTCAAMIKPLEDAYKLAISERNEKHAMEIRGNEANHQAQLRAMEKQLEAKDKQIQESNDERRKVAETANHAYREMNEVLGPFTNSNHAVAERMHSVEKTMAELKGLVTDLLKPRT